MFLTQVSTLVRFLIGLLILTSCSQKAIKHTKHFSNGGKRSGTKEFQDKDSFFNQLLPGETLTYWDDEFHFFYYEPNFSNIIQSEITTDLTTNIIFHSFDKTIKTDPFEAVFSESLLTNEIKGSSFFLNHLSNSTSSRQISSSTTTKVSIQELLKFFLSAKPIKGMRIIDFFSMLNKEGYISKATHEEIISLIKNNSIDLNSSLQNSLLLLAKLDFEIEIVTRLIFRFAETHKTSFDLDLSQFQFWDNISSVSLDIKSGVPSITLTKSVDKSTIFYDSEFIYSINFINEGEIGAKNIKIIDCLPHGLRVIQSKLVGATGSKRIRHINDLWIIVWTIDEVIPPGGGGNISIKVRINN
ncbi:MAG: hypothetical protein KC713_07570 [Candidatus Omnitrophica bacterium]|nr:hypothetical protein [Candidatus Omnitrophota bacterium]